MKFKTKIKQTKYQNELKTLAQAKLANNSQLRSKLKTDEVILKAAELLSQNQLVALPTETVYGLAANALAPKAVSKIFAAKGRPQDNPLIVHIADQAQLKELTAAKITAKTQALMDHFWPGPLTIIFPKSKKVPNLTSAGLETIAIRMPAHPLILAVIESSGLPLAAPSANTSGFPSPTQAEHVYHDLKGKIPLILDGGPCQVGVESTVVDLRSAQVKVLRPGGISRQEIADFLGEEVLLAAELKDDTAVAPGMKYRHYAPNKKLYTFNFEDKLFILKKALKKAESKKIAIISARNSKLDNYQLPTKNLKVLKVFSHQKPAELAQKLFALMRSLDADPEVEEIYIEELAAQGIGEAVMNRIQKAAAAEEYSQPGGGDN